MFADLTVREVWQYVNQLVDKREAQARQAEMVASSGLRAVGGPGGV